MNREKFETASDRDRQTALCEALKRTFKVALKPLDELNAHYKNTLDYFAYYPKGCVGAEWVGVAWIEVKYRHVEWTKYDAIMLSVGKWRDGIKLAESTGLPFVLYFQFKGDAVYRYQYDPKHVGTPFQQKERAGADTTKMMMPYGDKEVDKNGLWYNPTSKLWVSPGVWTEWGGRYVDDRDGKDSEPVVMIPRTLWEPVAIEPEPVRDTSLDKAPPTEALPAPAEQKTDGHPF